MDAIYARVRQKKRALDQGTPGFLEPPDALASELGLGSQALVEMLEGIAHNRDVLSFPLRSELPIVGPAVGLFKRGLRRLGRFYLLRQTGFNQYTLEFLRVLAEQCLRLSAWAGEQEASRTALQQEIHGLKDALAAMALRQTSLAARNEAAARETEAAAREAAAALEELQRRVDRVDARLAAMTLRADVVPRVDTLVGLLSAPRDLYLVAKAEGPLPPRPELPAARPSPLPRVDFAPDGGRVRVYEKLAVHLARCRSVLDLGCGDGELLSVLVRNGIAAMGIDRCRHAVDAARRRGLPAEEADIGAYLAAASPASRDGVALTHVIEHFEPEEAFAILCGVRHVLAPGGVLLIVTPNPESYFTSMVHFWRDPSHRRPYPLPLLTRFASAAGFTVTEAAADPDTVEPWLP